MTLEKGSFKPIAIIGMSMRLPGGVSNADDYWQLLINKQDGRCRVPESRYNVEGFRGECERHNVITEHSYFLQNVNFKAHDMSFFPESKTVVEMTDPQLRLLLEVVWECIENAGVSDFEGSNTGVYVGSFGEDWHRVAYQDTQASSGPRVTNSSDFILSNKISHQFDLRGPSLTIRTACSASMSSLHLACQALQNGDCTAAIVAGSNLILNPSMTQDMSAQGVLSPDGSCKPFDAAANGYARSEAINAILIKPLEDAIRDKDPIRAVIRSTAANSDGRTSKMFVPSTEAQVVLIRDAYKIAGISDLSQTAFVECHGTGTPVGDLLETAAVGKVFGDAGTYIGSVKANLGHTEGASGITSVIKAVLALENGIIPPQIKFSTPNPKIPFEKYKLQVPVEPIPWPQDRHARVSVNCFGIGGANAHAIIDSAASFGIPRRTRAEKRTSLKTLTNGNVNGNINGDNHNLEPCAANQISDENPKKANNENVERNGSAFVNEIHSVHSVRTIRETSNEATGTTTNGHGATFQSCNGDATVVAEFRPAILPISASNEKSLMARIADIQKYVQSWACSIDDLAHTLGCRRVHLSWRTFCIADADNRNGVVEFEASPTPSNFPPEVAFVFSGQGAQWAGMGKDLCRWIPSFLRDIQRMDRVLQDLPTQSNWSIEDMLCSDIHKEAINRAEFAQPLCTAVQIAIANLLILCGIKPKAVVGHSSGEIAAAYVAGALTMDEAIICSHRRGLAMKTHAPRGGRMVAVGMNLESVSLFLIDGVHIACENSPKSVTLSGDANALEQVIAAIKKENSDTFVRQIHVDTAYHSHHMRQVGPYYEGLLALHLSAKQPSLPIYSTVTGRLANSMTTFCPAYWRSNLESPVLFHTALRDMMHDLENGPVLIEIGPHSTLRAPLRDMFHTYNTSVNSATYIPTLVRNMSPTTSVLTTLGQLYSRGHSVDFSVVNPTGDVLVDLPLYPWDHSLEIWGESRLSEAWRFRKHPHHELLGASCTETSGLHQIWRNMLSTADVVWLKDHRIVNDIVFPCAGYVAIIGEAIRQVTGSEAYELRNLMVKSALVFHETESIEVMTVMNPLRLTDYTNSPWYEFTITSFNGTFWVQHCIAHGKAADAGMVQESDDRVATVMSALPRLISGKDFYRRIRRTGFNFGPRFCSLTNISVDPKKSAARAIIRKEKDTQQRAKHVIHTTTIDACLQLSVLASGNDIFSSESSLSIPSRIGSAYVCPTGQDVGAEAAEHSVNDATGVRSHVIAMTKSGQVSLRFEKVGLVLLDTGEHSMAPADEFLSRVVWRPHIDFSNIGGLMHRTSRKREDLLTLEKVIALCIIEFLDVMETVVVSPPSGYLAKYVTWLNKAKQEMLSENNLLIPEASEWARWDTESRKKLMDHIVAETKQNGDKSLSATVSISCNTLKPDNVRAILSGDVQPLQLYIEHGGLPGVYQFVSSHFNSGDFFSSCAHAQPNLKVIEIGGGTAQTTEKVLHSLVSNNGIRMYSTYMFTDISAGFFASARERLKDWEGVEYKTLDITKDPSLQGFAPAEYDVVVASNVLHATPSLHETLKNVRSLLRPGGRLFLEEITVPTSIRFASFIMGLLPGWWLGEHDGRADQPMVSLERWDLELRMAGFCGIEASLTNDELEYQFIAHIVSSVPYPRVSTRDLSFLYDQVKPEFACQLASVFERDGMTVHWVSIQDKEWVNCQQIISVVDLEKPFFHGISEKDFTYFVSSLSKLKGGLLWFTHAAQMWCTNPSYGLVIGLARTVRAETSLDFWTAELQSVDTLNTHSAASIIRRFLNRPLAVGNAVDCEFSVHNGSVHVGRYDWSPIAAELEPELQIDDPKQVAVGRPGMLNSIHWVQDAARTLEPYEVEVRIHYAGLNFRDIMVAMGILPGFQGYEAAGVVTRVGSDISHVTVGDRIMALSNGLFATRCVVHGMGVVRIPDNLGSKDAATMPLVYSTVILALELIGKLEKGQSILIHSAAGGVGQAALQISQMLGAEIYVTVGSEEKVQFIEQNYGIPRERIFDSRSTSFYSGIMHATNDRGVDLVLNSLSGELLQASWRCVARCGKMLEIGKRDIIERGQLALDMFEGNRSFHGLDISTINHDRPRIIAIIMAKLLQYYTEGHIKPVRPIHAFSAQSIVEAFRFMQSGKHIGKIIITFPDDSAEIPAIRAAKEMHFDSLPTYFLVGGLGGLGKAITMWMVEKGARSFVFLSRSAGISNEDQAFLLSLKSQGCSATAVAGNVTDMKDVMRAVMAAPTPIAGLIQMSMILKDIAISNMTYHDWKTVQEPKVTGTWNLHQALTGAKLDFFVLLSSLSGVHGTPGQANYNSANAFLDSFVQYRHSLGLPCSAINMGPVENVGVLSRDLQLKKQYMGKGIPLMQEKNLMDAIRVGIRNSPPPTASFLHNSASCKKPYISIGEIAIGLESTKPMNDPANLHPMRNDIRMGLVWQRANGKSHTTTSARDEGIMQLLSRVNIDPQMLEQVDTLDRLTSYIARTICGFLMVPNENVHPNTTVASLGVDSLVSIEIRNWWRRSLGVDISVLEVQKAATFAQLGALAVASLKKKYNISEGNDDITDDTKLQLD